MKSTHNTFENEKMVQKKEQHPDWIWPQNKTHVILGTPGSLETFKTPVEPGNVFSPGIGTYGVSTWAYTDGVLHTPEEKPENYFNWYFEDGFLPILHSEWKAGNILIHTSLFTDGDDEMSDYRDYLSVSFYNPSSETIEMDFYLAIRSFGASGGPVRNLAYKDDMIIINDAPSIYCKSKPSDFSAVSYAETKSDISVWLKKGVLPEASSVKDDSTWASGALSYKIALAPNQKLCYDFIFLIHSDDWMLRKIGLSKTPFDLSLAKTAFLGKWTNLFETELSLPDKRFEEAYFCQLTHLYMFTVPNAVRITPVSYPISWLRDGSYIINALNKGGFTEFCERACRAAADKDSFGGFGSEGDGPGNGVWILSEHYLLTGDKEFLCGMYPHIKRKAELIQKMIRATKPIKFFTEYSIPKCLLSPHSDMLCAAAADGLISGRMDHHFPTMWVNGFAYMALRRAAMCAKILGFDSDSDVFEADANNLRQSIRKKAEEIFGDNDRDFDSAFWPTGWALRDDGFIVGKYGEFWNNVRFKDKKYTPEPLWTYFEAGQAHNYLLLGDFKKAWTSIEYFLSCHTAQGLYTYHEGVDGNTSYQWALTRGWDDVKHVTPHGWTAAELFLLLRDCLAREEDGKLIIGSGIPLDWLNKEFYVKNLRTYFGMLSFSYTSHDRTFRVSVERQPESGILLDLPSDVKLILKSDF